jgi:tetratricopeptide (TPR) repeat protein
MNRTPLVFLALTLAATIASPVSAQSAPPATSSFPQSDKIADVNAAVVAARAATKEKRYADAEALMLSVTSAKPELVIPWVELGLAQLGLKKYPQSEDSFKRALGIDPASLETAHSEDYYQLSAKPGTIAPQATRTSRNTVGHEVTTGEKRPPDVLGTSYASLGEIYIREGKITQGQASFDKAVQSNPSEAALYFGNEAVFFFQIGNTDAQLAAAEKAIAADPQRAMPYYLKAQALASKATIDPQTQQMVLPPGCSEAYQKYLRLEPNGQFSADAKGVLLAAGTGVKAGTK